MTALVTEKEFIIENQIFTFKTYSGKPEGFHKQIKQVHGREVLLLKEAHEDIAADGIYTLFQDNIYKNTTLNILTADCLPVALMGENGMAMIHAGWKGLKLGILKNPKLSQLKPSKAFLGPHIGKCCYQVSDDFFENFPKSPRYFPKKGSSPHFCLKSEATNQLKSVFPGIDVESSRKCSMCKKSLNSYRRDKTNQRNWNTLEKRSLSSNLFKAGARPNGSKSV